MRVEESLKGLRTLIKTEEQTLKEFKILVSLESLSPSQGTN